MIYRKNWLFKPAFVMQLAMFISCLATSQAADQNKVVVIPLESSGTSTFVNVEVVNTWECPLSYISTGFSAICPANCIAVGGGCSAKSVSDATDVQVTGGNFIKTQPQQPLYNAYECYMAATGCDPSDPPIGYAQVVCSCL